MKKTALILVCAGFLFFGLSAGVWADTGTTFTEQFGDSSILCWTSGSSICNQMWDVVNGTANSIVASPAGAPAAAGANSLYMNGAGQITTNGSFPAVPAGTTFDIYFDIYVASQANSSYFSVVRAIGASSPASITMHSNGTATTIEASGSIGSASVTLSIGAWHSVQLHIDAIVANSYLKVDSGSNQSFTAASYPFYTMQINSDAALPLYIGDLRIDSAVGGGLPPSNLIDFTGSSDTQTLTTTLLANGTHCGNGTWTGTLTTAVFTTSQSQNLPNSITTCDSSYAGNTGLSVKYDLNTPDIARYSFTTTATTTSVGFFYRAEATAADYENYDIAGIQGIAGENIAIQTKGDGSSRWFQLEISKTTSPVYGNISYSPNTWYWITLQYQKGGTHSVAIYNASTWALLGTASGPAQANEVPSSFGFMHVGAANAPSSLYAYYSNILLDYASGYGTFPLLPDMTTPTVDTFGIPSTSNSLTVSITTPFTATDNAGVTGYLVNEVASTPSVSDVGWSGTPQTQYVFSTEGAKTLYAWAKDAVGNVSTSLNAPVTITLDNTASVRSAGLPSGNQVAGTTEVTLSLTTNEASTCKYGTTADIAYASIASTFTTTGGTSHSQTITGLTDGTSRTYFIRCIDASLNANLADYAISFSIASASIHSTSGTSKSRKNFPLKTTETPPSPSIQPQIFPFTRDLSLNSEGGDVVVLQQFLILKGYLLPHYATGFFGPLTQQALIAFQVAQGISSETGYLGLQSRASMNESHNEILPTFTTLPATTSTIPVFIRSLALGSIGSDVKSLQIFLNAQGFTVAQQGVGSRGQETTYFGSLTLAALIKFQNAFKSEILTPLGLTQGTGYFGPATMRKANMLIE